MLFLNDATVQDWPYFNSVNEQSSLEYPSTFIIFYCMDAHKILWGMEILLSSYYMGELSHREIKAQNCKGIARPKWFKQLNPISSNDLGT